RGMLAGLDIEIASTCYQNHLEELITSKQIDMSLLDDAVRRVLILKRDIGLFENPYKGAQVDDERMLVRSKSHLDSSLKIAHESAVLLKNDHILPIDRKMTIALIGPYAKSKSTHGPWSWKGDINLNQTLEDALDNAGVQLVFLKSAIHEGELTVEDLDKMSKADVVIVAAGEQAKQSGEAHSRSDIHLPNKQNTLVKVAKKLNKPVVLILFNGRPLILDHVMEADAILETWFLGSRSSEAIVDLIYGNVNPSGKLPMSFPRNVGQVPVYYNHLNTGRPIVKEAYNEFVTRYLDVENTPLFPFGYGLSYANFVYKDFNLDKTEMELDQTINVSVSISNDSQIAGYETVQLYIRDYVAHTARPVKELKKFQKIWIEPNMYKTVQFQIGLEDLMYQDDQGNPIYEIGRFAVMVGPDSEKVMSADFVLKEAKK
ncbi:MAG: glycoside hydrolase family 3 C-terminal domain-containing protein, partial [Acholeplasmataceae bacterium]|nr:glycoside hydrolase family 3 C-terminal domain-containing protein [Acholeplasmataceae bacterium]